MERIVLEAEDRTELGKGPVRALRRAGFTPAVLYRAGRSRPIKLNKRELLKFINSTMGEQVMITLKFPNEEKLALLKEYQVDPVKNELLHTDFYEVSLKEKVRVTVAVVLKGEPIGVKRDGGVLQHGLSEIEIECLPEAIPPHIEVDVTELRAGESIHVGELQLPEGIKVLDDPKEVLATVTAPTAEVEAVEEEAAEVEEPEVIKKGKKEEAEKAEESKEE
ncbi:MAG: 50S ribosomal protein L25 [Nitrospirae bacterium]|nr:MAG: 50S ribosomal protein L25 [Nitrospirota bacterium]